MNDNQIVVILQRISQLLEDNSVAIGKEELTVTNGSSVGINPPENAKSALIQVQSTEATAPVITFWENGSDPSATSGMFRSNGDYFDVLTAQNLAQFRVYGLTGTTKLMITYYK